jgi:hypothetical protein
MWETEYPHDPPEIQASGMRLSPPRLPPAPPGTGGRSEPPGPSSPGEGGTLADALIPCLSEFAVIRTTFETMQVFPDDEELAAEMQAIIDHARGNLARQLQELRDQIAAEQTSFRGTDLRLLKTCMLDLAVRGVGRQVLDAMMKVDVFQSVSYATAVERQETPEPRYYYTFLPHNSLLSVADSAPSGFARQLLDDLLWEAEDEENYKSRYAFERSVFQKFIAIMFAVYTVTVWRLEREDLEP